MEKKRKGRKGKEGNKRVSKGGKRVHIGKITFPVFIGALEAVNVI